MGKKIAVIGLGNMGASLLRGLQNSESCQEYQIYAYDTHPDRRKLFIDSSQTKIIDDMQMLPASIDAYVLCIKPHDFPLLAVQLKIRLDPASLVISILAGVKLKTLAKGLDFEGALVRSMPNIAATIGEAATAMCCNEHCSSSCMQLAEQIFKAVGEAYWTKESLMDTVTGLSGSGPAYIYMVIEALTDGGVKMGLPRELSHNLATQTVLGAASLVKKTQTHPAILKDQVTTPAGTTISALHELEERGLRSMFVSAVEKATERSKLLGKDD